jgi:mRNA-degrading endonuclease YafQ of YafQ-DinJ toxin-antitoxin module
MASTPVAVTQSSVFARAYKKLHLQQKQDVDKAVEAIILEPLSGEAKRGDLAGVYVYKFKSQNQLVLLAYEFDPKTRHLLLLGSHENFYQALKR